MARELAALFREHLQSIGRARPHFGSMLALALATSLFLTPRTGAGASGRAACPESSGCDAGAASVGLRAEIGDVWIAIQPVEVALRGPTEGRPVFRALAEKVIVAAAEAPGGDTEHQAGLELAHHTVQEGDTLAEIAARFKIDVQTLVSANDLKKNAPLSIGTPLVIPPVVGLLHLVREGETVSTLAERYQAELQKVVKVNALEPPYTIAVGQPLLLPDGKLPLRTEEPAKTEVPANAAAPQNAQAPGQPMALAASIELPPATALPLPRPPGASPQRASFILGAAEAARESQLRTGVPASVTIAQAILESDWGMSRLSAEYHNYFGIKATSQSGSAGVVFMDTWEVINGQNIIAKEPFRAYARAADSFIDHGLFFHQNRRYAAALAAVKDPQQFAREINKAGYATDPIYAPKLITLMDRYNLYAYDLP